MVEPPIDNSSVEGATDGWEEHLRSLVSKHAQFSPVELYCLKDVVKAKYHQPYFPERELDEQSVKNAIRVRSGAGEPVEISKLLTRMKPITEQSGAVVRYYIPHEVREEALNLSRGQ